MFYLFLFIFWGKFIIYTLRSSIQWGWVELSCFGLGRSASVFKPNKLSVICGYFVTIYKFFSYILHDRDLLKILLFKETGVYQHQRPLKDWLKRLSLEVLEAWKQQAAAEIDLSRWLWHMCRAQLPSFTPPMLKRVGHKQFGVNNLMF